jgi:hypothetical protein
MIDRNVVPARCDPLVAGPRIGNTWAEAGMWPTAVIVYDPLFKNVPQVPLIQRDQKVQAFAADCSYQSLAESACLGSAGGCLQYCALADRTPDEFASVAMQLSSPKRLFLLRGSSALRCVVSLAFLLLLFRPEKCLYIFPHYPLTIFSFCWLIKVRPVSLQTSN